MPYKKYHNKNKYCRYPFENMGLGYCWGYAWNIDDHKTEEEIEKDCSQKDEKGNYYCEFYNMKAGEGK